MEEEIVGVVSRSKSGGAQGSYCFSIISITKGSAIIYNQFRKSRSIPFSCSTLDHPQYIEVTSSTCNLVFTLICNFLRPFLLERAENSLATRWQWDFL
jgi:hypothetical protein